MDHGEKLVLPMELFWNKHYFEHFRYLGFDMDIAEEMFCYDRFRYLFYKGLASNLEQGMSLNVCAAIALYHNSAHAEKYEKYQGRSDEAWAEHDKRAAQIEDTTWDLANPKKRQRGEPASSSDSGDDANSDLG